MAHGTTQTRRRTQRGRLGEGVTATPGQRSLGRVAQPRYVGSRTPYHEPPSAIQALGVDQSDELDPYVVGPANPRTTFDIDGTSTPFQMGTRDIMRVGEVPPTRVGPPRTPGGVSVGTQGYVYDQGDPGYMRFGEFGEFNAAEFGQANRDIMTPTMYQAYEAWLKSDFKTSGGTFENYGQQMIWEGKDDPFSPPEPQDTAVVDPLGVGGEAYEGLLSSNQFLGEEVTGLQGQIANLSTELQALMDKPPEQQGAGWQTILAMLFNQDNEDEFGSPYGRGYF